MSRRVEMAAVVAACAVLSLISSWPLVLSLGSRLPSDLGDPLLTTWTLAWDADRLRHGLQGVWDAPNFFPYHHTLLYSDHLLGLALFTAPVQWVTGNPVLVYNLAFLSSFVLAAAATYLLVYELTGRRDAAIIGGLIFACQPFRVSHMAHLQWLVTGWLPLSLWAMHRYFAAEAGGYLILSAAFFLLQALTTSYYTYFGVVPLIIVFAIEAWRRRALPPRFLVHAAAAVALVVIVMLPVARAYYDVRDRYGFRRAPSEIADKSADVGDYFSAPPRLRLWPALGRGRGEHELFPGAAALALAAVAAVALRRQAAVRLYLAVAAVAFALSLGPSPSAWGYRPGVPGPYAALLHVVPGLDSLRAVARLAVVVQIGIAVLAAYGFVAMVERVSREWRLVALVGTALAVIAEGWAAPIPTAAFDWRGNRESREAYAYLKGLPAGGALDLPFAPDLESEFAYQYMTLIHGHPVVNGHSGYLSPLSVFLGGGHSPLNELDHLGDAVAMARSIGVRYLVLHVQAFATPTAAAAWIDALNDDRQIESQRSFGDVVVAILRPGRPPERPAALHLVPNDEIVATASQAADRLPLLFDGDRNSRWLTGRQSGTEWLELRLAHPHNVRVVRMQLAERSFGDYPRELAVDVIEGNATRTVSRGSVLPQFAAGLLTDPEDPKIDLMLPDNHADAIRLRQLGATRTFFWSIHELALLEQ